MKNPERFSLGAAIAARHTPIDRTTRRLGISRKRVAVGAAASALALGAAGLLSQQEGALASRYGTLLSPQTYQVQLGTYPTRVDGAADTLVMRTAPNTVAPIVPSITTSGPLDAQLVYGQPYPGPKKNGAPGQGERVQEVQALWGNALQGSTYWGVEQDGRTYGVWARIQDGDKKVYASLHQVTPVE